MNQVNIDNQTRNDETSNERLRELLLRVIAEDNYVPNHCRVPEHDESEIASTLTGQNRIYYEEANNDDDSCQYYIANSFLKGRNQFPVDKAIAFKYMKKAASHGNKYAIYGLSYLMIPNISVANDFEGAENYVKMLRIATYFNSCYASYILGYLYSNGFHVEKNNVISLIYLKFSADKMYPPAMLMFADQLRKITKKRIHRNVINRQKTKSIDFLNDKIGINSINHKLSEISVSIFHFIKDRKLAFATSLVYYMNVIQNKKSTDEQKHIAQQKLTMFKK